VRRLLCKRNRRSSQYGMADLANLMSESGVDVQVASADVNHDDSASDGRLLPKTRSSK